MRAAAPSRRNMTVPRNLIGGIATVAIGGAYLAMASGIRASALADTVGPAGFPKALAYAMIGLGLLLCAQSFVAMRSRRAIGPGLTPVDGGADDADHGAARGILRAAGMLALGVGYLLVVRYLGYLPSIALLITAAALYLGTPFSWRVVGIAIAGAIVYWIVFVWILGIPQPPGLLGGLL